MESGGGREGIRPSTAEDEALKRNTDCVYFLASPLTCNKGNECEYRHNEGARANPRDCWYWLNGSCLNPKCLFRHPPLDGLFGTQGPSSGPVQPPSRTVATTQIPAEHAPYIMNKQSVPCYYFQRGHCLKGERCPFMHGPQASGNPVSQQVAEVTPTSEPAQASKKDSWAIKDCTAQHNVPSQQNVSSQQYVPEVSVDEPKVSVNKPVQVSLALEKPVSKAENAADNIPSIKKSLPPYLGDNELDQMQQNQFSVSSGYALTGPRDHQVQPSDDRPGNDREVDEFLRESSPGFDVLVDDDIEESGYFNNEDNFGRASVQGGRNLNHVDKYDCHHNDDESGTTFERDQYGRVGDYDRYGQAQDTYGSERCRTSERILERSSSGWRVSPRDANHNERNRSDLRHRLSKQRRLNGSISAVSPYGRCEPFQRDDCCIEERERGHHSHRNQRQIPRGSSISTRLQGRITLPRRSSPDIPNNLQSENDGNRGRPQGRLSSPKPINYRGWHHERVRWGSNEEFTADARSTGVKLTRRDDSGSLDFASPKSLAELKGAKVMENSQESSTKSLNTAVPLELNNLKSARASGLQDSKDTLSFEGPKPLSVILKRKREAASVNGARSRHENYQKDEEDAAGGSVSVALSDVRSILSVETKKDDNDNVSSHQEEHKDRTAKEEEEEGVIHGEEGSIYDGRSSAQEDMFEPKDHVEVDAMEDQELECYDRRHGESGYGAAEGGDLKTEYDEIVCPEDEDEFDDEDDFAKKGMFVALHVSWNSARAFKHSIMLVRQQSEVEGRHGRKDDP